MLTKAQFLNALNINFFMTTVMLIFSAQYPDLPFLKQCSKCWPTCWTCQVELIYHVMRCVQNVRQLQLKSGLMAGFGFFQKKATTNFALKF